jgi:hypothetical protein
MARVVADAYRLGGTPATGPARFRHGMGPVAAALRVLTQREQKDGLQPWCRECKKVQDTGYYQRNEPRYLKYNREQYERLKHGLIKLKELPCADCGGVFPPYVMDFDHFDASQKRFDVGRARKHSLALLKSEIARCELVCANGHRIRTHGRSHAPLV